MRNTITVSAFFFISLLLLITVLGVSCVSINENLREASSINRSSAPVDAFVLVQVEQKLEPIGCSSNDEDVDCDILLSQLPPLENTISGSGLLVNSDAGPVVLTAEHVCEREAPEGYEYAGVKIAILNVVRISVISPIKGKFSATIVRTNVEQDLCILRPEKVFTHPVSIATTPPQIGDKVYSIGAPYGISGHNLALVFNGFFSGTADGVTFYTIPTRPGSSGSSVLNEDWEVVGCIHAAFRSIENVGVGTGLTAVRDFLFTPVSVDVQAPSLPPLPTEISPIFE